MMDTLYSFSRRGLIAGGGALLVGFSLQGSASAASGLADHNDGSTAGPPDPAMVDSWIAIHPDTTATLFHGKSELGQGITTGLLQIACEELDLDLAQMSAAPLDTNVTPQQAPTVASLGIWRGGPQVRAAAAEARQALLTLASTRLGAPVTDLVVTRGIISVKGDHNSTVSYGQLLGDKPFEIKISGKAPLKKSGDYRIVGSSVPRIDLRAKIDGSYTYAQHIDVPNMVHGRIVRPRGQGAYGMDPKIVSVDEGSIAHIPGANIIRKNNFLGVTAPLEWDAVRAAQDLKVVWDAPSSMPGNHLLHDKMRSGPTTDTSIEVVGEIDTAFRSAKYVSEGVFYGPYQAHAPFAPNCAIADVSREQALVLCSSQDVYRTRDAVAQVLGVAPDKVRVQYCEGSGTFGHSAYHDIAQSAALMSQIARLPVRLQFMRWDEFGYDNFGPAQVCESRIAADADGRLLGIEFHGWQHAWITQETAELLALATKAEERTNSPSVGVNKVTLTSMYDVRNTRLVNHHVSGLAGYPKGSYLRSPLDIGFSFAAEQMIDSVARAAGLSPLEFRRRNIKDQRWLGVLNAAANAARMDREAPSQQSGSDVVFGRGLAVGTHHASYAAAVAEVEVNRSTGEIIAKRLYGALDAGLIVNPKIVEAQIIGMMTHATSRVLKEEVTFSNTSVTSLDWDGYPVLRFSEHPVITPVVLQQVNEPATGAGEELMGCTAAAIANAVFNATGVQIREFPMTPQRVKLALNGSGQGATARQSNGGG